MSLTPGTTGSRGPWGLRTWAVIVFAMIGGAAVPGKVPPLLAIASVAIMPVLLWRQRRSTVTRLWLAWAAVWCASIGIADWVASDVGRDSVNAVLRPLVILGAFFLARTAERRHSRVSMPALFGFTLGSGLVLALFVATPGQRMSPTALWKYDLGWPLAFGAVMLLDLAIRRPGRRWWPWAATLTLLTIGISVASGARSLAMTECAGLLAAAAVPIWQSGRLRARMVMLGVVIAVCAGSFAGYGLLASHGLLGTEQKLKWIAGTHAEGGRVFSQIVGDRADQLNAITIIRSSPVIGIGSSLSVDPQLEAAAIQRLRAARVSTEPSDIAYYFPSGDAYLHSRFSAEWASHGVVPALCLGALLVLMWVGLFRRSLRSRLFPIATCFVVTQLSWDFFFSPWDSGAATLLGLSLGLLLGGAVASVRPAAALPDGAPAQGGSGSVANLPPEMGPSDES